MSVTSVDAIASAARMAELLPETAGSANRDFGVWLENQLTNMDSKIAKADEGLQALATGETSNVHQVLLALEETRLSFSLMVQVRNKVLEAYQDIMRMQV